MLKINWLQMTPIQKTLIEIQQSQNFDKLDSLKDFQTWTQMSEEEKDLFALLLLRQGALLLERGDGRVLDSFALAAQVGAQSPSIFYQQAVILSAHFENSRCLQLANQALQKATESNPSYFEAWYHAANVCVIRGLLHGESHFFIEGNENYEKAAALLSSSPDHIRLEEFYWKWGTCLFLVGKHSGEPVDFYTATNQYRVAQDLGCHEPGFYTDYGSALTDLGTLLKRKEIFYAALKLFEQATYKDPTFYEAWYHQGCCLLRLIELIFQDDLFLQASHCFERAAALDPEQSHLWMYWGRLESNVGKLKRDEKLLESSLAKFAKSAILEPDNSVNLNYWAETELFLGTYQERIEFVDAAKSKIITSLKINSENTDSWYIYGACLNEYGQYFEDSQYFKQAIEKFQYGLTLSNQNPLLWYGLALSHYALGDISEEQSYYEKALRYCSRVIECEGEAFPQFWNDWGIILMKMAEITDQSSYLELAIEKFEKAFKRPCESDSEDVDLEWVYNYGCAFDLLGDLTEDPRFFEKAITVLTQVVLLDPSYIQARYNLALAYSHLGEISCDVDHYFKALENFQAILEHDPEDEIIHMDLGVSLANLALLLQDDHQRDRSQELFHQAEIHLFQAASLGNCQAYYQLAGLYSLLEQFSLAMFYLEKAQSNGGLPHLEDMMHDDWLEGLRHTPSFRHFLNHLSTKPNKD